MKNIFDFATKELSQDAFLMWLLENYEDEEIGAFAKYFLLKMIDEKENSTVTNLKTRAQCKDLHNADVLIECKINGKDVAIVLEDKVFTGQHDNQLEKIEEKMVETYKNKRVIYCIFYKTGFVSKKEVREIKNNNKNWRIFNSYNINECFEKFYENRNIPNMLLSMYRDYIKDLVTIFNISDDDIIDETKKEWGEKSNKWVALFDQFDQGDNDRGVEFFRSYWFKYIFIKNDDNFFSVEIRSNTMEKGKYSLKLVMYSMNEDKQTLENLNYFRELCENKKIKTGGGSKQVASITKENIFTVGDLKNAVNEVVSLCEDVYKDFDVNKLNLK